jgi:hypothetical protein
MGHKGGEPMLRGVGELLRWLAPGLVHHIGGGASRATGAGSGEARGATPTETAAPMMAAAESAVAATAGEGFRIIVNQKISYECEQESQDLI